DRRLSKIFEWCEVLSEASAHNKDWACRTISRFLYPPFRAVTVIPLGRRSLPGSSDLPGSGNGAGRSSSPIWSCSAWGLPCRHTLLRPRCALTAPFHPYPTETNPSQAVLFSV